MTDLAPLDTLPPGARLCGARDGFELAGRSRAWQVVRGMVDVFLLDRADIAAGYRHHVLRVEAGGLLCGTTDIAGGELGLFAVPGNGSAIVPFDLGSPPPAGGADALARGLEAWIDALADALAPELPPVDARSVPGIAQTVRADKVESLVARDAPLWASRISAGARYDGNDAAGLPPHLPLAQRAWLTLPAGGSADLQPVAEWCRDGRRVIDDLASFHDLALAGAGSLFRRRRAEELADLAARDGLRGQALAATVESLVSTVEDRTVADIHSLHPLLSTCELVGAAMGIAIVPPQGGAEAIDQAKQPVALIARASRVQCRTVGLHAGWWKRQAGPLVGQWRDGTPCALLPSAGGRYRVVDRAHRIDEKVTAEIAARIDTVAHQLCEPLPDGPVGLKTLLGFCLRGVAMDASVIFVMVLLAGALSLVPPLATKEVFDSVIPSNQMSEAVVIGIGLLVSGISLALFNLVQGIGLLRIEGRLDLRLQTALWDRVVRAPAAFFREYSSGDLVSRMQTLDSVRKLLTGSVISSIISSVMGLFSFGLMLFYSPILALIMAALTMVIAFLGFLLGWRLVSLDRQSLMLNGRIQAMTVQYLGALEKLRVSATEDIAFERWAEKFRASQVVANKNGHAYVAMLSMMGVLGPLALAVLFTSIGIESGQLFDFFNIPITWDQITGAPLDAVMPIPQFIAFITAYVQFLTAATGLMTVCIRLSAMAPMMGRLTPIFQTATEHFGAHDKPGRIEGGIEFKNVTFRYTPDGPAVLDNLSFTIEPGEFVALVGPSGSGKSSAIRLLLGFETASSGTIYLDGRDLARMDKSLVREQLGVVIQDGRLIPGTIFDNLTGGADVSRDEVWEAAKQAGFAQDLDKMPQGLDTPINDGATNLSGGQRQRLLIARALVRKPRLLILDEATSALDNETQEIVSRTVQDMSITRIAVAHRLSTIIKADRIFVIAAGTVVESGSYDELMARNGAFAELVRRQVG